MNIHASTHREAIALPAITVVRESRLRRFAWPFALATLGAAFAIGATTRPALEALVWPGAFFLGFGLITLGFAIPGMRAANWAMRLTDNGLYINPRATPTGEYHDPQSPVLFIPFNAIREAHKLDARLAHVYANQRTHIEHHRFITFTLTDITIAADMFDSVQQIPEPENADWLFHLRDNELRLEWKGPGTHLVPPIDQVLATLSSDITIAKPKQETDPYANRAHHESLDRRLDQLCRQGKTRQAVSVARERYGLPLADAILHVEGIMRELRATDGESPRHRPS